MSEIMHENIFSIISLLFGTGGIGYALFSRILYHKKYLQEVREATVEADAKSDAFWKNRYDVLNEEMKSKDEWWKNRYANMYSELQNQLSNEIIKSFRPELNEIREEYENQRNIDKKKYNELLSQYEKYQEETHIQNETAIKRISQLEDLVSEYERRLKMES